MSKKKSTQAPLDPEKQAVGVDIVDGQVIMMFQKPVTWIGMDPAHAEALAEALLGRVELLRRQS